MGVLSECLSVSNSCQDNLAACSEGVSTLLLPKPLQGAPLSDAMIRAAQDPSVADGVVERYQHFVETCIPDRWEGWSYTTGDYEGSTTYTKQQTPEVESQSSFIQGSAPNASNSVTAVDAASSSSFGPFVGGLLTGLVLIGGVWAFTLSIKRNSSERSRYHDVEMISNDLTLA